VRAQRERGERERGRGPAASPWTSSLTCWRRADASSAARCNCASTSPTRRRSAPASSLTSPCVRSSSSPRPFKLLFSCRSAASVAASVRTCVAMGWGFGGREMWGSTEGRQRACEISYERAPVAHPRLLAPVPPSPLSAARCLPPRASSSRPRRHHVLRRCRRPPSLPAHGPAPGSVARSRQRPWRRRRGVAAPLGPVAGSEGEEW